MKAAEVVTPQSALDNRRSPLAEGVRVEYAIRAGGSVLNHRRFASPEDAYFYGCAIPNARDRERYGHVIVRREVVMRLVRYGEWDVLEDEEGDNYGNE